VRLARLVPPALQVHLAPPGSTAPPGHLALRARKGQQVAPVPPAPPGCQALLVPQAQLVPPGLPVSLVLRVPVARKVQPAP
jgi:hypothetical protein